MADNVAITAGSGTTVAADDIGGVKFQRIKLIHGADGTNDGDVASGNPLPVVQADAATETTLASLDGKVTAVDTDNVTVSGSALPTGAATSAKQDTGNTLLGTIDTSTAATSTVLGAKDDAKSTATDTTAISIMSVLKQVSASIQAAAASLSGTLTVGSHAVTNAGTFAVQEADGANTTLGSKADNKSTATDTTAITAMSVWKQISSSVQAIASSVAGTLTVATHAVTQSGTWTVQPGNTANTTAWKVDGSAVTQPVSDAGGSITVDAPLSTPIFTTITPSTTGGWTPKSLIALSNTKTAIKAGAGTFGGYMFYNPNSSVVYLQVWNVAIGSITVGTTAPTYVIPIPATAGANVEFTNGINHSAEINIAATTTATGSTAPSTAIDGFALYK